MHVISACPPCALDSAQTADTRDFGEQSGVRHPFNSLRLILSPSAPSLTASSAASGEACIADSRDSKHAFCFVLHGLSNGLLPSAKPRGRRIWKLIWRRLWMWKSMSAVWNLHLHIQKNMINYCFVLSFFYLSVCILFPLTLTETMPLDLGKTMPELYWLNYATDYFFENFSFLSKHSLPSWVVNQGICVYAWNFNGKRGLQKYHLSIPLLDTLQIASHPAISKRTFMWSQVAQPIIQKGKKAVIQQG